MVGQKGCRYGVVIAVALLTLITGCSDGTGNNTSAADAAAGEEKAVPVDVVSLRSEQVTLTRELPARVMPFRISQVRPQVDGLVVKRLLEEGLEVEEGQPLYQIDPLRYQAAVENARAEVARAKANLEAVKITEKRYKGLLGTNAVSEQQYDDVQALLKQREAELEVAKAALQVAEVDLHYTTIRAPISGRIEQFMVTEGALLEALQDQSLATIRQLDPIYVDMYQPAAELVKLKRRIIQGEISVTTPQTIRLRFDDGSDYPHGGDVAYTEMNVSQSTGSVLIRALVPNPEKLLMPGLSLTAVVEEGVMNNAVLVPQRAVNYNRSGEAEVMLVNTDNRVEARKLELGRAIGTDWLVVSGAEPGDRVVVAGLQKIKPGALVEPTQVDQSGQGRR
ncbi:MAG: efflux RND transporter periplasmic adaptor subunit [Ketobacteraceae bacterium]|nr:efflux RND transporter periplasmic adaptor subunit [Ketobacteraceae bacterium]